MKKFYGKKNSIQRSVAINFIIAVIVVLIASIMGFYLFVNNQTLNELVHINVESETQTKEIISIMKRTIFILIFNTIAISIGLMRITEKKMLQPLKKITDATKIVASGDFNIKLETERKDEIGELTNNFNKMVTELGSIECLQKEFIDNVSHEIKTPINSIQGFANLLKDEKLSKKEKNEYIEIIEEETNRILNLSSNMLKLSKLQNQNRITNKDQVAIVEQIRKAIVLLEEKWKEKEIQFNMTAKEKYIYGDEELLFQVWVNLIDNAIKFSKPNGKIDIILKENEEEIEIQIKDYGYGMDEDEKEKVFSRFYQIDKSHSEQGSGLGLAIVKRIIDLSKGTIEVISKKNVGTTMIVRLPIEDNSNKIVIE